MMKITNPSFALEKALEMVHDNLQSCTQWVSPEDVNDFIKKIYDFLLSEEKTPEK